MTAQEVDNNRLGSYPVLVDKNAANSDMQVMRLDVGVGDAESRVSSSNPLPVTGTVTATIPNPLPVTGTFFQATQPVSGIVTATPAVNATATLSNVAASASSVTVLALNANRKGATVYNDSTVVCYLKLGSAASSTSFTVKMQPEAYYEIPFSYTGILTGIWASATGSARVTEVTA